MFDNKKPNIILLSDLTNSMTLAKTVGPYKVAYELRSAGYEVAVIHHLHMFSFLELQYILQNLISDKTLFVGINSMFYQTQISGTSDYVPKEPGMFLPYGKSKNQEFRDFVNKCNPNCKIVLGGPDASDASYIKDYDYVVAGYADMSIVNLANYLNGTCSELLKSYKSIHGPIIIDDSRAENFDFPNSTMRYEEHDCILPGETLVIEISRGCIFSCAFCRFPLNGKKKLDYLKQEELLYQEFVDNYKRFGITRYRFSDDTFNDSREKIEMIHRISKRLPFKLEYWVYLRLDLLTAHIDLLDKLYESGLRSAFFGIESLNAKTNQLIGKGSDKEKQLATLKLIKERYGDNIFLTGSFIFGLPAEPLDSMMSTRNFLISDDNPLDFLFINPYYIYTKKINGFSSKIEENPEAHGYKITGTNGPHLYWENQYTNFEEVKKLAAETLDGFQKNHPRRGVSDFDLSTFGIDVESVTNNQGIVDWKIVLEIKKNRFKQYKDAVYKEFNILKPFT